MLPRGAYNSNSHSQHFLVKPFTSAENQKSSHKISDFCTVFKILKKYIIFKMSTVICLQKYSFVGTSVQKCSGVVIPIHVQCSDLSAFTS